MRLDTIWGVKIDERNRDLSRKANYYFYYFTWKEIYPDTTFFISNLDENDYDDDI